jgi:hypothetical protein
MIRLSSCFAGMVQCSCRFVALTSGLLASAGLISGGTSDAMSIGWRVDGTVTFVSALKPGDGPRFPAVERATGVPPSGACGTVAELKSPPPGGALQGLDTAKKLVS